jgi:hypothetical protein
MLWTLDLLLNSTLHLSKSVFNISGHIRRKYRAWVHRLWHGLLPRSQQAFHSLSGVLVHYEIGVHERLVHVASKIDSIRGANVLDNGVKHIESWKLEFGTGLSHISHLQGGKLGGKQ